jgi:hypothetical protein
MYKLWIENADICMMNIPHAISYGSNHRRLVSGVRSSGISMFLGCHAWLADIY